MANAANVTVKIVTDSAADFADDTANASTIEVVPLSIRFDDEEFTDGIELSREEFWQRMATSSQLPSTSAPSPGAFENAFRQAATDGFTAVVCLTISGKLSATHQIAVTAANAVKDTIPVFVVDTQACAIAQALLCKAAVDEATAGSSAENIAAYIEDLRTRVHLYATLDTLENLKKGGRIGAAGAFFGSLLSIKPIVGLVDGEVKAIGRARTRNKAIQELINLLTANANPQNVVVGHSYAPDIEEFTKRVSEAVNRSDVDVSIIGPVVGTHTGPRLRALAYITPKN
jgi:DegV family protein with EDD domain